MCPDREENGKKEDPGKIPTPEFRSPFDVEPWTCPLDFFKMCCTGQIGPDGRAFGCAYCKTTISYLSYSTCIQKTDVWDNVDRFIQLMRKTHFAAQFGTTDCVARVRRNSNLRKWDNLR